jgi:hypothetical protein
VLEALEELDELVRPEQLEIEATRPQPEEDDRLGPVPTTPAEIGALTVDRAWAVVAIVGSDRALVLRGRYIELAHRVLSRVSSPAEQSRLMREVSRLNPESWQTEQEARTALAGLESAYTRLAEQLRQQPRT